MNKTCLIFLLALLSACSAQAKPKCHIEGMIEQTYNGYLLLQLDAIKQTPFKINIPVSAGKFSADISLPNYGVYTIMKDSDYKSMTHLIIDTPFIQLYKEAEDSLHLWCKGSIAMQAFSAIIQQSEKERTAASNYMRAKIKQPNDTNMHKAFMAEMDKAMTKRRAAQSTFISQFPGSFASAYELTMFSFEHELDTIKKLFFGLTAEAQNCSYGKKVLEKIKNVELMAIGKTAPDFKAKDTTGKAYRLSDFKGKYVLLDFTASWCAPCRMSVPFLQKVNREFGNKVQVISVSVDKERASWISGIKRDSMAWLNISDPGEFNSKPAKAYKLEGVPSIYLISPAGTILTGTLHDRGIYNKVKKELESHN